MIEHGFEGLGAVRSDDSIIHFGVRDDSIRRRGPMYDRGREINKIKRLWEEEERIRARWLL